MSVSRAPVSSTRNDPAVEAAFEAADPDLVAEIIDGELYTMPRPRPRHARASTALGADLAGPFQRGRGGPGGWVFLDEPELPLGPRPDKVVPDLAAWRRARFPAAELDASDDAAITVVPDWVCEVLSDRTEAIDRGKKRRIYRREGVQWLWYIDPRDPALEVWTLSQPVERGEARWLEVDTFQGDAVVRAPPFDAIEIDLAALFHWDGRSEVPK